MTAGMHMLWIALGTLASEDLALAAAGVLVARGDVSFAEAVVAGAVGIFVGDLLLFFAGRLAPKRLLHRLCPPESVERAAEWLNRRGMAVVLISRLTPGLRLPTYVAAGVLRTDAARFAAYFAVAAALWTPLVVGAASVAGGGLAALVICAWLVRKAVVERRRIVGFVRRKLQWEFWPAWAAYVPVAPYFLYLSLRHRSLTLFTAANPGIPLGGLVGESKFAILRALARAGANTGSFELIDGQGAVLDFARRAGWPIVLKPDVGERGSNVAIIRSPEEAERYLRDHPQATIAQSYHAGLEFGVYYHRAPGAPTGRVLSIAEKRFPEVTGDGRRRLRQLILDDQRAVCMAPAYLRAAKRDPDGVPAADERVPLVEIGSHCRGAIFLDGRRHWTPRLEAAVDHVASRVPGFHLGRFDLRAESVEALREGRFAVIELNGVSAEPAHVYDPAVPIVEAYRAMFQQWRLAFETGAENVRRGARPASLAELISAVAPGRFWFAPASRTLSPQAR